MIPLLLALALASPIPAAPPTALEKWGAEVLCWDSGQCSPRVVKLGAWDPIPQDYQPAPYTGPTQEVYK